MPTSQMPTASWNTGSPRTGQSFTQGPSPPYAAHIPLHTHPGPSGPLSILRTQGLLCSDTAPSATCWTILQDPLPMSPLSEVSLSFQKETAVSLSSHHNPSSECVTHSSRQAHTQLCFSPPAPANNTGAAAGGSRLLRSSAVAPITLFYSKRGHDGLLH